MEKKYLKIFILVFIISTSLFSQVQNKYIFITYDFSGSMKCGKKVTNDEIAGWNSLLTQMLFNKSINIENIGYPIIGTPHCDLPLINDKDIVSYGKIGKDFQYILPEVQNPDQFKLNIYFPTNVSDFSEGETYIEKAEYEFLKSTEKYLNPIWVCISDNIQSITIGNHPQIGAISSELSELRFKNPTVPLITIKLHDAICLTIRSLSTSTGPCLEINPGVNPLIFRQDSLQKTLFRFEGKSSIQVSKKNNFESTKIQDLTLWLKLVDQNNNVYYNDVIKPENLPYFLNNIKVDSLKLQNIKDSTQLIPVLTARYYINNSLQNQDLLVGKERIKLIKIQPPQPFPVWLKFLIILLILLVILFLLIKLKVFSGSASKRNFVISYKFPLQTEFILKPVAWKIGQQIKLGKIGVGNKNENIVDIQAPEYSLRLLTKESFEILKSQQVIKKLVLENVFEVEGKNGIIKVMVLPYRQNVSVKKDETPRLYKPKIQN